MNLEYEFEKAGGILRCQDMRRLGLTPGKINSLKRQRVIIPVRHGYYSMRPLDEDERINALFPEGILCMDTALYHYGYIDKKPAVWHVAMKRSANRSQFVASGLPVQEYYIQENLMDIGKSEQLLGDVPFAMYDRERVICDCFRFRSSLDWKVFEDILERYRNDPDKNLNNLWEYAKLLRVATRMEKMLPDLLPD